MAGVRLYVRDLALRSRLEEDARTNGYPLADPDPSVAIVDLADERSVAALEADDPRCRRIGFYAHREPQYLKVAERLGAEPVEKRVLFGRRGLSGLLDADGIS